MRGKYGTLDSSTSGKGGTMDKSNQYKDYLRKSYLRYSIVIISAMFLLFNLFIAFNVLFTTVRVNRRYNRELAEFMSAQYQAYGAMAEELSENPEIRRYLEGMQAGGSPEAKPESDGSPEDNSRLALTVNQLLYEAANKNEIKSSFILTDSAGGTAATNLFAANQKIFESSPMIRGVMERIGDSPYFCVSRLGHVYGQEGDLLCASRIQDQEGGVLGYLFFDLRDESFFARCTLDQVDDIVITDRFNNLIFATSQLQPDPMEKFPAGKYQLETRNSFLAFHNGKRYYFMQGQAAGGAVQIYTLTSVEFQLYLLFYGIIAIALTGGLMVFMLSLYTTRVSKRSLRAFDQLQRSVEELGKGNVSYKLPEPTFDEIAAINEAFREKVIKLEAAMEHNNELAERKRQMELKHLEEQFNPHFVFNVLETLRYEILIDSQKASDMVVSFANLLRYSIYYGSTRVTLQTDIEYINDYLLLQKMRYNRRLTYHINIPEELFNFRIPKLLLQPVVENSLKYAGEQKKYIEIWIEAVCQGDSLVLSVKDNGDGMEAETLNKLRSRLETDREDPAHIGLYNVHRTVRLLYGPPWGLEIESRVHQGTEVTIRFPAVWEEGEEHV